MSQQFLKHRKRKLREKELHRRLVADVEEIPNEFPGDEDDSHPLEAMMTQPRKPGDNKS